jgi:hypothetical protein
MADLALTGIGMSAGMQYMGIQQQAKAEESMYEYNALVQQRNAEHARSASREQQLTRRAEMRRLLGAQRTGYAKAGVQMVGSPVEVQLDTLTAFEGDIAKEAWNYEIGARQQENAAAIELYKAKSAAKAGKMAAFNTLFGAGTQMATFGLNYKLNQRQQE